LGVAVVGFAPAGGLALGAALGAREVWLTVATALVALALAIGWPALTHVPEPHSARLTLTGTGGVAIALAALWPDAAPSVLVAVGLGLPACFVRELARPAPRADLVRSVAATACGVMAVAVTALWVAAARSPQFEDLAVAAGCGIAAACLALGLSGLVRAAWAAEVGALLGLALAGAAGAAISFAVGLPWWAGAAVAAACGVGPGALCLAGSAGKVFDGRPRWRDAALVTLPLAVAAVSVWAAGLMR
jgi:hypothetical protein